MKFVSYKKNNQVRIALIDADDIVDIVNVLSDGKPLGAADLAATATMTALIEAGERGLDLASKALEQSRVSGKGRSKSAAAHLVVPLRPGLILASGGNYSDHRDEKDEAPLAGREPEFFFKTPHTVVGPDEPLELDPRVTTKLDYEVELAVVIGKTGRHIPEDRVLDHIFGYTIINDITARERQVRYKSDGSMFYESGSSKNFDKSTPIGPCIVTRDEIPRPQNLALRTYVNKELRQNNNTKNMTYSGAYLAHFFSTFLTLYPGYMIATGTPGGTAWGNDPELGGKPYSRNDVVRGGYLQIGDVVSCEVEGIGALSNPVGGPQHA
jgi:2-keto-4-pentenoate hydratase/2-oxohepta-3-ene-1,7-dioic acid hydratase in catechol pathway